MLARERDCMLEGTTKPHKEPSRPCPGRRVVRPDARPSYCKYRRDPESGRGLPTHASKISVRQRSLPRRLLVIWRAFLPGLQSSEFNIAKAHSKPTKRGPLSRS